ncbi:MAG: hypothetical protein ACRD2L_10165, partial [Terriglobia bacterium]
LLFLLSCLPKTIVVSSIEVEDPKTIATYSELFAARGLTLGSKVKAKAETTTTAPPAEVLKGVA